MFRAVLLIGVFSTLKTSETIEREEKVLVETNIVMIGTYASFFSVKRI